MVAALKVASAGTGRDLREDILRTKGAAKMRKALFKARDLAIKKHLKETVFTPEAFSLLRLITKLSKRECGLIQQSFKYKRLANGKSERFRLAPDSEIYAPEIFSLPEIVQYEREALESTRVELRGHEDKRGADVAGKPYALDRLIMSQLQNDAARWEGMATRGTKEDPHVWLITGDGAGLSKAESGIRVGVFPGSTEMLNQSSMDVTTVLFYKAAEKGESYPVMEARLSGIQPDIARLYNNGKPGELMPDGQPSGIFVELGLTADKPFERKVNGLLSHNATFFGQPLCDCHESDIYNLTFCKKTHYNQISYEQMCHRAHVPTWMALHQPEPRKWSFTCDCCGDVFSSENGGKELLLAKQAEIGEMTPDDREKELKKHADKHKSQKFNCPPLIPCHHYLWDPMHAVHNELNVILDEAIHRHLIVEGKSASIQKKIASAKEKVNKLWKDAQLPAFIQWGKDGKGEENSHALNGPTVKKVLRHATLLPETFKIMQEVWELLETEKVIKYAADGVPEPREPPAKKEKVAESAGKKDPPKKAKPKKKRPLTMDEIGVDAPGPSTPPAAKKAKTGESASPGKPTSPGYPPAKDLLNLTYAQRAAAAVCAFISLYTYLHENSNVKASTFNEDARAARGAEASARAVELQRTIIAVAGTHRRRVYAHDLVYGMHKLYTLFARPWNAATEGNEHAHQDMKNFFKKMVCHKGNDALEVLQLLHVKEHVFREVAPTRLPNSEYAAARVNSQLRRASTKKDPNPLPAGSKLNPGHYKPEDKMERLSNDLRSEFAKC